MIKFYYHPSPNPAKIALFLEEAGLPYELVPVDTRKGEQFSPSFKAVNPNAKTPAIVDGDVTVFDSNAILLYLGEKTGKFMPANNPVARGQLLSWLMFVASGIGPYSGQAVHFNHHAPEKLAYAMKRYGYEAERHYAILDAQLAKHRYMLGDSYTIVDMAVWGWAPPAGVLLDIPLQIDAHLLLDHAIIGLLFGTGAFQCLRHHLPRRFDEPGIGGGEAARHHLWLALDLAAELVDGDDGQHDAVFADVSPVADDDVLDHVHVRPRIDTHPPGG